MKLIFCLVFSVVISDKRHTHTQSHRHRTQMSSFLMAQWSPDPMTCDVQMLSWHYGSLYPSVCLHFACVFIIYFAFWQKDFKTIILMFFPHILHIGAAYPAHTAHCSCRETDITLNWVCFTRKMLKCSNDFCQFLAFKLNFSLHLTFACAVPCHTSFE